MPYGDTDAVACTRAIKNLHEDVAHIAQIIVQSKNHSSHPLLPGHGAYIFDCEIIVAVGPILRIRCHGRKILTGSQCQIPREDHDTGALVSAPGDGRREVERLANMYNRFERNGPCRSLFAEQHRRVRCGLSVTVATADQQHAHAYKE
jgi:hypothetical protein